MKKTGLKGYVQDFSVDYDAIEVSDILDIRKYLMKKKRNSIKNVQIYQSNIYFNNDIFWLQFIELNPLECVSMNNQECEVRSKIFNVNSNEPLFYPFSIKTSKCSGSRKSINNPYAKLCVPDVAKNINVKVFNLISRTNETRYIEWDETCKCKCRSVLVF